MANLLKNIIIGVVFSGYYFPFEFTFLPGFNTKMGLAVIGMVLLTMQWLTERNVRITPMFLTISAWASVFSLSSLFSVTYNNTTDYVYATYIVKMWVWLSGAYAVLYLIREMHKEISFRLVFHYMAWVCAIQAILALIIDNAPTLQNWVDTYILQDTEFLHKTKRLYGIGVYFDTAGIRFSCALLGLGYLLTHKVSYKQKIWYWILFIIISIIGNIISRTTLTGLIISLLYIVLTTFSMNIRIDSDKMRFFINSIMLIAIALGITLYFYLHVPSFRSKLQYGFEGFFNWYKIGNWSTSSTTRLQNMFVLPDNLKTWLIGDGWFANPDDSSAFYKYTDVGYLRFIFYCGCVGLSLFISFFMCCTSILFQKWKEDRFFLLMLFLLELVVWVKISTDIFAVYALLLLLDRYEIAPNNGIYSQKTTI